MDPYIDLFHLDYRIKTVYDFMLAGLYEQSYTIARGILHDLVTVDEIYLEDVLYTHVIAEMQRLLNDMALNDFYRAHCCIRDLHYIVAGDQYNV